MTQLRSLDKIADEAEVVAQAIDPADLIRRGNVIYNARESRVEFHLFLGTVFQFYPSGKYYTPFANSNLDPCPACGGAGRRKQTAKQRRREKKWWRSMQRLARRGLNYSAKFSNAQLQKQLNMRMPCEWCNGLGSHEAAQDEAWSDGFESGLPHGVYVECGEGDPCDLFLAMSFDMEEGEDWDDWVELELSLRPELRDAFERSAEAVIEIIGGEKRWL